MDQPLKAQPSLKRPAVLGAIAMVILIAIGTIIILATKLADTVAGTPPDESLAHPLL